MLTARQARFAFLPLMMIAMSALIVLAAIVFRQGLSEGAEEAWMLAWVLAFTVALPTAMLVLPAVGALLSHHTRREIIPLTGEKIPGAGQ